LKGFRKGTAPVEMASAALDKDKVFSEAATRAIREILKEITKEAFNDPKRYIAAGELKGGIDPAGADEHWKTANSALDRIRTSFIKEKTKPALFFVGAAIESSMATEIFEQLENGHLAHAANLTSNKQLEDLASWLTNL